MDFRARGSCTWDMALPGVFSPGSRTTVGEPDPRHLMWRLRPLGRSKVPFGACFCESPVPPPPKLQLTITTARNANPMNAKRLNYQPSMRYVYVANVASGSTRRITQLAYLCCCLGLLACGELPRTPCLRTSENLPSTHSGE